MNRLADFIPQPRPMTLGGGEYLVSQFQLRDVAELESWVEARLPNPMACADMEPGTPERRQALRDAMDLAERGLPGINDLAAILLIYTPAGRSFGLWLSLRKAKPELDEADAITIASEMAPGEWAAFDRVAWAKDLQDEIQAEIYGEVGVNIPHVKEQSGGSWAKAYLHIARTARLSPDQFADLTVGQWGALISGGEPKDRSISAPPGWSTDRFEAEILDPLEAFWAENQEVR